jgi:hypothetical protein
MDWVRAWTLWRVAAARADAYLFRMTEPAEMLTH